MALLPDLPWPGVRRARLSIRGGVRGLSRRPGRRCQILRGNSHAKVGGL